MYHLVRMIQYHVCIMSVSSTSHIIHTKYTWYTCSIVFLLEKNVSTDDTIYDTEMIHVSSTWTWYTTWYILDTLDDTCIIYTDMTHYMIHYIIHYMVHVSSTLTWYTTWYIHDTLHDTCIIYMASSTCMIQTWYMRNTLHDTCIIYMRHDTMYYKMYHLWYNPSEGERWAL